MVTSYQPRPAALKGMQGPDRVAAILLTMGKSLSGRLMKHFDAEEIKQITRSATDLKPVPAQGHSTRVMSFPRPLHTLTFGAS